MSKIICAKSGIPFTISHLSYTFSHRELAHPAFSLPTSKLLGILPKWYARELTPEDSTILFLSLLNSSGLVEFRTHAAIPIHLVESNMESLSKIVHWIHAVPRPSLVFPKFAITKESQSLSNIRHWIQAWIDARLDYEEGTRQSIIDAKIRRREEALERLIKSSTRNVESLAPKLAVWAAMAASFPTFSVTVDGKKQTISEYWQSLILKCASKNFQAWRIKLADLHELKEHCEEHLELGSIYSHALFSLLRKAIARHNNFLGFDEMDTFTILDDTLSTEAQSKQSLIDTAPATKPIESHYPSKIAYLRAKIKWEMAESAREANPQPNVSAIIESLEPSELVDDSINYLDSEGYIDPSINLDADDGNEGDN